MDEVEEIKSKIDIVDFIQEYLPLSKTGSRFRALCPFHQEKTPSFIVSPERQRWHCFGACNEGGDVFSFLMKKENLEFPEALRILAKKTGIKLRRFRPTGETAFKERLYEINHLASEFYHFLLTKHKVGASARDYLKKRHISDGSIKLFKIGYAPESWDVLYRFLVEKRKYQAEEVEKAGLIIKTAGLRPGRSYYDRFRGRIIFTLFDHRDNVIGLSGRMIAEKAQAAKYINSPETLIYHKGKTLFGLNIAAPYIREKKAAIIVEGEFDVIGSFQSGVKNVVAVKGTALTEAQLDLIKRFAEKIILGMDMDLAGNEAARRGIELADTKGLEVAVIKLLAGKDPFDCVAAGKGLWHKSVKGAVSVYDYLLERAVAKHNLKTALGMKKFSEEILPWINKISNLVVQNHYLRKAAKYLEMSETVVAQEMERLARSFKISQISPIVLLKQKPLSRSEVLEEYFLALILQSKKKQPVSLAGKDFDRLGLRRLFEYYQHFNQAKKKFAFDLFIKDLAEELKSLAEKFYLKDISSATSSEELFQRELKKTAAEIKKISLRRQMSLMLKQMAKAQDKAELKGFNQRYHQFLGELKRLD